jgi:hypothetical protein
MIRVVVLVAVAGLFACNPVRTDALNALPGEAPGVRNGPLHRPGEPCLLCHDGAIGDPAAFSIAGTVFAEPSSTVGVDQARVSITDATGVTYDSITTNAAGNFYITPNEWSPAFPILKVSVTDTSGLTVTMQSEVGRDGACASCHFDPAGSDSPGHVSMVEDDGGVPP